MKKTKSTLILLVLLLVGIVFGGIIGQIFHGSFLAYGETIGFDTVTVDLGIMELIIGFKLSINIASIIGIFLALFIYSRM